MYTAFSEAGAFEGSNESPIRVISGSDTSLKGWQRMNLDASRVARAGATTEVKAVGVNYCIKATSGLSENAQDNVLATINENNSYSTTEHATGKKWIDGKPVYKKTWTGTTSIDGWNEIANLTALNISKVVKAEQVYEEESYIQGNYYASNTNRWRFLIRKSDMALIVDATNNAEYVITLEYTKTTD